MKELFTGILNISISAGILIIVCTLVRLIFRRMPKFVRCLMWLLVAIRLAVPIAIESPFSLLPAREYVTVSSNDNVSTDEAGNAYSNNELTDKANAGIINKVETADTAENNNSVSTEHTAHINNIDVMYVLSIIWLVGVIAVLIYALVSYIRLRRIVDDAVLLRDNIYQSERVGTAFIIGVIRPRIYVPYGLSLNERYMSISHEKAHISRRDHLVKPLGFIIAAVYWFNPLVWLAYILLCRDIELACDEKVIKKIGYDKKKDYSQALLNLSIPKKYISACPVAFGEVGINERIKNVLTMKKGKKIIIAVAVVICAVLAICFLTYPKKIKNNSGDVAEVQASEETGEEIEEATTEKIAEKNATETNSSENVVDIPSEKGEIEPTTEDDICYPVMGSGTITRQFSEEHQGVDIAAEEGTAIASLYDGTVEEVGSNEEEGNYIIIKNEKGCTVKYSHLKDVPNVTKGDKVSSDKEVGKVGSTGKSTGPHVHIELTDENGTLIDPMSIIEYK
ncbi:MAG: peptidoglycan DD-metalloendopeptidase family protein [Eubacterium sp.]|nr:peptidoglycan DD-metalloendopeptidase family protein [Eubacterium sp.]